MPQHNALVLIRCTPFSSFCHISLPLPNPTHPANIHAQNPKFPGSDTARSIPDPTPEQMHIRATQLVDYLAVRAFCIEVLALGILPVCSASAHSRTLLPSHIISSLGPGPLYPKPALNTAPAQPLPCSIHSYTHSPLPKLSLSRARAISLCRPSLRPFPLSFRLSKEKSRKWKTRSRPRLWREVDIAMPPPRNLTSLGRCV